MTTKNGSQASSPDSHFRINHLSNQQQEAALTFPKVRSPERAVGSRPTSEFGLPLRPSTNASLSAFFASNPLTPLGKRASSPIVGLPRSATIADSFPASARDTVTIVEETNEYRNLLLRAFAPHIAVLPSYDTEELLVRKGIPGGLLGLLRPFGDRVQGKVTIRDSSGSSRSCDDYAVHFVGLGYGLDNPRDGLADATSPTEMFDGSVNAQTQWRLTHLQTGGDVGLVEEAIEKHFLYADAQNDDPQEEGCKPELHAFPLKSIYHQQYMRSLLSGLPLSPHETFSHPVACIIAVSSQNADPIEEFRQLHARTRDPAGPLPSWVSLEYLRFYVLIHDEENDDAQKSNSLFDQMKRHFGLHCHLLRIRSTQCVPSDDDCVRLPVCQWLSAAEELSEIKRREDDDDLDEFSGPYIYDSDGVAVRNMVRELVTQSVIPMMERSATTWNDQVVSRRRGFSGRFLSFSKKWTPFGSSSRSSSPWGGGSAPSPNSNYDAAQGTYRPDTPEAIMRRLADYAFMLRDFKLALSTYELLRADYANDKAWKYQAGANEMTAISALLVSNPLTLNTSPAGFAKISARNTSSSANDNNLDSMLESACYLYITRCSSPYYALRALAVSIELLQLRGRAVASAADDSARWCYRVLEQDLMGPLGQALYTERLVACYASRQGLGSRLWGNRRRKAALWSVLASQTWMRLEMPAQAAPCLAEGFKLYRVVNHDRELTGMKEWKSLRQSLLDLMAAVKAEAGDAAGVLDEEVGAIEAWPRLDVGNMAGSADQSIDEATEKLDSGTVRRKSSAAAQVDLPHRFGASLIDGNKETVVEGGPSKKSGEKLDIRAHRRGQSLIGISTTPATAAGAMRDPLGATTMTENEEDLVERASLDRPRPTS